MTRLEELLYSLTAVIIRYHDSQPKVNKLVAEMDEEQSKEKYLTCAKEIIQNPVVHFKIRLSNLIKQCTDSGRRPFLYYILHEVTSLKALLDKTSSLEATKLEEYKNQIAQLFIDLKLILDTPKSKKYKVTYSKSEDTPAVPIALIGLKSEGFFEDGLCNSGDILKEGVFKRFGITTYSSNDDLKAIAEQICMEHQLTRLVPELFAQIAEYKKTNSEQEEKLNSLSTQHQEKQKKVESASSKQMLTLYLLYIQYKRTLAREEKQKIIIDKQQQIISELQQKISELTQQVEKKPSNYRFYSPSF
ncbi:Uncharacterised protein [Legionella steigerwaltii]|uniref:Uncharacterized protein n=1 Tax=Legionella steigerwaltii TaxID=460 RepID=A0A378L3M5_9GAMM|nr:hypothetical protein [Legionella steigerwaltii]KTD72019.1 hypothetical protein Lstg_2720 [Legionella steigerwaltii]STY21685.1 Uncharacterised protein [Legionella steigerwaltii]